MIFGHERVQHFFEQVLKTGNFHHAYAFIGPSGVGKKTFAQALSARILRVAEKDLPRCPDFSCFGRNVDEKTQKMKKDITVAQAREIKEKILHRSWLGGKKILLIDEAERLNEEASNALLKVLEEPSADTIIFLIIADENQVLPTILSRCQKFSFTLVEDQIIEEALRVRGAPGEVVVAMAGSSAGRIGRALSWLKSPSEYDSYVQQTLAWEHLCIGTARERWQTVETIINDTTEVGDTKDGLIDVLQIWVCAERSRMLASAVESPSSLQKIFQHIKTLDTLMKSQKLLTMNVQPRLVLENILLTL